MPLYSGSKLAMPMNGQLDIGLTYSGRATTIVFLCCFTHALMIVRPSNPPHTHCGKTDSFSLTEPTPSGCVSLGAAAVLNGSSFSLTYFSILGTAFA